MGLPLSHAPMFSRAIAEVPDRRACLFLGDQQVYATEDDIKAAYASVLRDVPEGGFDPRLKLTLNARYRERNMVSCVYFARMLGFETVDVLDIDDQGFVNLVHDLNHPDLKAKTSSAYDVIFDGGTLEHIFSVERALRNIGECTAVNGIVIHLIPMNNFINHGFFQISPALFFDYYGWNKWDVLQAFYVCEHEGKVYFNQASATERAGSEMAFPEAQYSVLFVARKTAQSTVGVIPTQGMYAVRLNRPREIIQL